MARTMVVIGGPTGIGKTRTGIELATVFNSVIISADSRQIYSELPIGTSAPTAEELAQVKHYLVGTRSIFDYYSAYEYEQDALRLSEELFAQHEVLFMVGGSMMYLDSFCYGIDELPTVDPGLRDELMKHYKEEGIEAIRLQLKSLDPEYYAQADLKNHKRLIHALEICLMTGMPYSSLRTGMRRERPFQIIRIGLEMDRDELYERINRRVGDMMSRGLLEEARVLIAHRHLNSLNTVGYKELFEYFDGEYSLEKAVELIQRNTRRYARKQMSWFRRDKDIRWFHPSDIEGMTVFIRECIQS
jgi:tRNA dimethylallyltransferase